MTLNRLAGLLGLATAIGTLGAPGALAQEAPSANLTDGCIEDFSPGVDYFPDKVELRHAENFSVSYHDYYKVVTVAQAYQNGPSESYVLVQCGAPSPELEGELAGAPQIEVPIASIFTASTTHNPSLIAIDRVAEITGISRFAFSSSPEIIARIEEGDVVEFRPASEIDIEAVIAAQPDVLMTGGTDSPELSQLREAGVAVVHNADWLDTSARGQAEWVKYIALYFNEEAAAEAVFNEIDIAYEAAVALAQGVPEDERPVVMSGSTFQGTFYAAGGRSFVARAIADAGGRYIFADNTDSGSTPLADLEVIIEAGSEADIWMHANSTFETLADIETEEPRLATLPAAQSGQVWMPDRLRGPNGGVQIYELGTLRPDIVLRDLIEIFHPGLQPDHDFVFYRNITTD